MDEVQRVRTVYADYGDTGRAERWGQDHGIHAERRALLGATLQALDLPSRPSILDLGCGRGDLLADLHHAGLHHGAVAGIDLLPDRLQAANAKGMAAVVASGALLPFPDHSFDLVTAFTLLSSVGDDDVLRSMRTEVARVLRPGGSLVIYDMRLPSPTNPAVRPLPLRRLRQFFDGWEVRSQTCTVLPPLARRVAPEPGAAYDRLLRVPALRSHRFTVARPPSLRTVDLAPLSSVVDPTVSVILPVRNEGPFIDQSLGAVLDQTGVAAPQVIVVDGDSDDGTAERVQEIAARHGSTITVLHNPLRIVPVSMNLGLAEATGEVVVRVDGHCVIAPDYLRRCLDALAATGEACVGGPMETLGETGIAASIAAAQSSRFGVGGVAFRTSGEAAFVDTLAFGAYRREVFERIGGFDEELVRNQDDELNLRLLRAGGRIWMDPSIRSTYSSRGTLRGLWRQYHGYGFYKVRVMRKHRTVPSPRHLVPAAFVAGVAGAAALSVARRTPVPLVAVLGPYGALLAASSVAATTEGTKAQEIALASTTMHTAYGLGWWAGAARAIVPGRRQSKRRTSATR